MTWQQFMKQSIRDHFKFGDGTTEISKDGVDKMNDFTFPEDFTKAMKEVSMFLESNGFKKKEPINALLMENIFPNEENEDAYITFDNDTLFIESRDNTDNYAAFSSRELWQIVAFALDNGLQLPQSEDDKE